MIFIEVLVTFDGEYVPEGCAEKSNPKGGEEVLSKRLSMDEYKKIMGDRNAKVRRHIVETVGAPGFSSIKVGIEIEVNCNQDQKTIQKTSALLFEEALSLVDSEVDHAYNILCAHVERNYDEHDGE